jgi:RND family efflux transporter MFP subunit
LKIANVKLARSQISVPFDGCVISEQVEVGQYVVAGQTLASVYGTQAMEVVVPLEDWQLAWFDVPARGPETPKPTRGAPVKVMADFAGTQRIWQGHVARLEGQIDPTSRMANVVVEVTSPFSNDAEGVMLMPGMFVQVQIQGRTLHDVTAIPRQALRIDNQVWVALNQRLHFRDVQVIRKQRETVYVSGLDEGQLVVSSALDVVVDGMKIRIRDPRSEPTTADADTSE